MDIGTVVLFLGQRWRVGALGEGEVWLSRRGKRPRWVKVAYVRVL